jgi:chromosomal replication initiation ATPase DnaA
MTLSSPEIQLKIAEWQMELRIMAGNDEILLHAYGPLKFEIDETGKAPQEIIDTVCDETGVCFDKVMSKSRQRDVVVARQLIAFFCRKSAGITLKKTGELLNKDHTTVIHSCHTIQDLLDSNNPEICRLVARIHKRFEMVQA